MSTSLTQLITDEHVVLGATPENWQDAIRQAAAPLLDSASISAPYVDRMIEVVDAYGPYIVLAPGVALAHAQPDGSVARTAMSALTIPGCVAFGHEQNDPVRLVLCLAAADSTSHLEALKAFVQIMQDSAAVDRLVDASTPAVFRGLTYHHEIAAKARRIGIAPGVTVHQMHRRRLLDYKFGNRLCMDLTGTFTG